MNKFKSRLSLDFIFCHFMMHRLPRVRIPQIRQSQRVPRSAPLLPCRSTLQRPYSSDAPSIPESPSEESTEEQAEDNVRLDGPVPQNYHIAFPDLSKHDPLLDTQMTYVFPANQKNPYTNKVVFRNVDDEFRSVFEVERERAAEEARQKGDKAEEEKAPMETESAEVDMKRHLPLNKFERDKLFHFPLISRRVTKQTGKGKIHRTYHLLVVGNGDGLVGYGEGKDLDDSTRAMDKALVQAVRNMDYVERFEKRTIFGEMRTKMGSTQIILRPRPVGFGLQCHPKIHQILKAAGIKDISAKVWGSRNPINVIKALFRILHSGNAPLYMGDGIGGKGRRTYKGDPIQTREGVERARGRKLYDLRV